ncbi:uncharacterized protein LOC120333166 [Styela clava]
MESGLASENINNLLNIGSKTGKTFMFTEEQITKQLVDMREQTDFMKKFRCAIGIALREIKTLRTTMSTENPKPNDVATTRKRHSSCSAIADSSSVDNTLAGTDLATSNVGAPNSCSSDAKMCGKESCVCSEFGGIDLAILREYLSKMALNEVKLFPRTQTLSEYVKHVHIDKLKSTSKTTENAIRHIDSLKQVVANKNAAVEKLCKQLTQARIMRVKREAKLEQKLMEMKEWKEKYEKVKKNNEKQVKITQGLRLTLNAERQKVKSSEKMARSLDQTRQAFESLKSQAGQLMTALRNKDQEIDELTAKLEEMEGGNSYMNFREQMTSQCHGFSEYSNMTSSMCQTDPQHCMDCERYRNELDELRNKYDILSRDFENYRRTIRPHDMFQDVPFNSSHHSRDSAIEYSGRHCNTHSLPHNHPYGNRRGRMHAPYTSIDSYRRVSRPPLRRRLHYDMQNHGNQNPGTVSSATDPSSKPTADALLSPIDESDESNDEVSSSTKSESLNESVSVAEISNEYAVTRPSECKTLLHPYETTSVPQSIRPSSFGTPYNKNQTSSTCSETVTVTQLPSSYNPGITPPSSQSTPISTNQEQTPFGVKKDVHPEFHEDGHNFPGHINHHHHSNHRSHKKPMSLELHEKALNSPNALKTNSQNQSPFVHEKSAKTSYLELGTSATPSPSSSIKSGGDGLMEPELCLNSFIRTSEQDTFLDTASDLSSLPNDSTEYQQDTINEADIGAVPSTFGVIWHPALIKPGLSETSSNDKINSDNIAGNIWGAESPNSTDITKPIVHTRKSKKSEPRCVNYKGHKIDVTNFSLQTFREIIWSLDGGPESSDDFIKFLASLAKKLNANPKWAGKHSMGNPADWLSLRGVY